MAITKNGTNLDGNALVEGIANGATIPTATEFTDYTHTRSGVTVVDKATIDESTTAATFNALITAVDTALDAIVDNDYDAANTVTVFHRMHDVTLVTPNKYTNAAQVYRVPYTTYVKVA